MGNHILVDTGLCVDNPAHTHTCLLSCCCPSSHVCRYFRQDSPYWRDFHTGVLSTGCLKEALGFNEPMASKLVGYKGLVRLVGKTLVWVRGESAYSGCIGVRVRNQTFY